MSKRGKGVTAEQRVLLGNVSERLDFPGFGEGTDKKRGVLSTLQQFVRKKKMTVTNGVCC